MTVAQVGLLTPAAARAQGLGDDDILRAIVEVEAAWLDVQGEVGLVSAGLGDRVRECCKAVLAQLEHISADAEGIGNPVVSALTVLREQLQSESPEAAEALHRGLTSQDVVDTALSLVVRQAAWVALDDGRRVVRGLIRLAEEHRATVMIGRTLTQHAMPTVFALKAAAWADGVAAAVEALEQATARLPLSHGGSAGTLAAVEALLVDGHTSAHHDAVDVVAMLAARLELPVSPTVWHTTRTPVLAVSSALAGLVAQVGGIAADVLVLTRPEIGELSEPSLAGRGGSSSMPHKRNPVLSVLIRRSAIDAPALLGTLHVAAGLSTEERSDGAWHAEWQPLRELAVHARVAANLAAELVAGLQVHAAAMRLNLKRSGVEGPAPSARLIERMVRAACTDARGRLMARPRHDMLATVTPEPPETGPQSE